MAILIWREYIKIIVNIKLKDKKRTCIIMKHSLFLKKIVNVFFENKERNKKMTAPLMPKATAVWLVENTTLSFIQIADFCELHELEIQAIADGDVAFNIMGISPVDTNQLTWEEIRRCEADGSARLQANKMELNVREKNAKAKKVLSPSQRNDKPNAIAWILKNCPELTEAQICKLVGTTKPTIQAIKNGTHKDSAVIRPKNPVAIGLCTEKDLEKAISLTKAKVEKEAQKEAKAQAKAEKKAEKKKQQKAKKAKAAKKETKKTVKKEAKKPAKKEKKKATSKAKTAKSKK